MKFNISLIFLWISLSFVYNIKYNSNPLNPTILQISTRPFLYQLSKERGLTLKTLRDIPDDVIEEWSNLKFDFVWFMGVWQVGPYGIEHDRTDEGLVKGFKEILPDYISEDAIGSPYAITDYVCNSELCPNGDNDLIYIRDKLNKKNIKLMLDFVPNHSALDSPWVDESMDYYIRAPKELSPPYDPSKYFTNGIAYGNMQYSSAWTDVGQLNYWNNNTRILMTNKLKRVASLADGIRCDMAYIILNDYFQGTWQTELNSWGYKKPSTEFWSDAIKEIKKTYPSTLFLAEVYGDYFKNLIEEGFDYTYDKELLDRFKSGHLDNTRAWITSMIPYNSHVCRFLENHDDNRAVTAFGGNYKMTMAAAVGTYTLPGLRFLFQDQWFCYRNKLDVHLRRSYSENKIEDCEKFYKTFFTIFTDEIFKNGEWTYLNVLGDSAWRLMAWSWVGPSGNKRLVALNFSQEQAGGNIVLSDLRGSGQVTLKELFSGVEYIRSADEIRDTGLVVVLESMQAQIFTYE